MRTGVFEGVSGGHVGSNVSVHPSRSRRASTTLLRRTKPGKEKNRGLTPIFILALSRVY
jgi:hypothetical protein